MYRVSRIEPKDCEHDKDYSVCSRCCRRLECETIRQADSGDCMRRDAETDEANESGHTQADEA